MQPNLITRIQSIDILRGLVMLIMALDHVRDFFHETAVTFDPLNLDTTTTPLFLTRWITHFCAPIFVFLSGVSAYISGQKKTKAALGSFLIKRGVWLILIELVIVSLAITFNPLYNFLILQVIWAIGWSMIFLGLLVRTSYAAIVVIGVLLVLGHNIFDIYPAAGSSPVMQVLFTSPGGIIPLSADRLLLVAYAILPWTGIMFLGYAVGRWYSKDFPPEKRRRLLVTAGGLALLLFILLRASGLYGDPTSWDRSREGMNGFLSFVNVSKYPASLQFTCLMVGTGLLLLSIFERVRGKLWDIFMVYGKVPFFYYVLHFYLIHILCVIFFYASGRTEIASPDSPFLFRPADFGYSLPVVYAVWLFVIVVLYQPCRWFIEVKKRNAGKWWVSYV
ncbi:MAG: heparan-alpha-glucosaminide N-acetyltransferase domain-containing protein [Chitinophagaceae bacterium]|nr:heparan-alpha-glucosaminide N-acetyltransferase domain-containing protein [Chitinophagaceae bacterium]